MRKIEISKKDYDFIRKFVPNGKKFVKHSLTEHKYFIIYNNIDEAKYLRYQIIRNDFENER